MAGICINEKDQSNYQTQNHSYNHVTNANNNTSLIQQKQHQQKQAFMNQKQHPLVTMPSKILTSSNMHNIQPLTTTANYMVINKKRYSYGMLPYGLDQLPSVARRNARERNRVKQVNNGFANLRQHIPQTVITALSHGGRGASKKLSKVDTLRIAVEYIRGLQTLLDSTHTSTITTITTTTNAINNNNNNNNNNSTDFPDDCSSDANSFECSSVNSLEDNASIYQLTQSFKVASTNFVSPIDGSRKLIQSVKLEDSDEAEFKLDSFEQVDDEELLDYISTWQDE